MGDEAEASGALLAGRGRRELKQRKFEGVAVLRKDRSPEQIVYK
jgi:hypothetical protein